MRVIVGRFAAPTTTFSRSGVQWQAGRAGLALSNGDPQHVIGQRALRPGLRALL